MEESGYEGRVGSGTATIQVATHTLAELASRQQPVEPKGEPDRKCRSCGCTLSIYNAANHCHACGGKH